MAVVDDYREERAELQSLLASGIFARSPSLAIFLQYICHKYFEGRADEIKEYSVAVEAFGRPADFDQKRDSIVRVEAHRLRRRLSEFYQGAGATHSIQIRIPPGQYAPVFVREHAGAGPAEALPSTKKPQTPDITVVRTQPPVEPPPAPQRWRVLLTAAPILIGVAAMTGWLIRDNWITTASTNPAAPPQPVSSRNAVPLSDEDIRIAAGLMAGRFVDRIGNIWSADRFFKGGEILSVSPRPIARTVDPELYVTRREGDFTYEIPLAPGTYEVRLHFAETVFGEANVAGGGEASRIFQVFANGRELMHEFDVLADAGGSNTANLKVFTNI
ncbi:MAG TPA: malectin domain-containing carbohydrate-binding protein, partial [Bryobacteraceae bacterium]|nr:malectin domain-containing carbohydrate-binding protein [Bryobacteraceae bacterium]